MLWTSQRPAKRAMRRLYAVYASAEMMKVLPELGRRNDPVRGHQSFDLLKPEAGVPRTLVEFDPRRASFA